MRDSAGLAPDFPHATLNRPSLSRPVRWNHCDLRHPGTCDDQVSITVRTAKKTMAPTGGHQGRSAHGPVSPTSDSCLVRPGTPRTTTSGTSTTAAARKKPSRYPPPLVSTAAAT